jgi:hypothetical protein
MLPDQVHLEGAALPVDWPATQPRPSAIPGEVLDHPPFPLARRAILATWASDVRAIEDAVGCAGWTIAGTSDCPKSWRRSRRWARPARNKLVCAGEKRRCPDGLALLRDQIIATAPLNPRKFLSMKISPDRSPGQALPAQTSRRGRMHLLLLTEELIHGTT